MENKKQFGQVQPWKVLRTQRPYASMHWMQNLSATVNINLKKIIPVTLYLCIIFIVLMKKMHRAYIMIYIYIPAYVAIFQNAWPHPLYITHLCFSSLSCSGSTSSSWSSSSASSFLKVPLAHTTSCASPSHPWTTISTRVSVIMFLLVLLLRRTDRRLHGGWEANFVAFADPRVGCFRAFGSIHFYVNYSARLHAISLKCQITASRLSIGLHSQLYSVPCKECNATVSNFT